MSKITKMQKKKKSTTAKRKKQKGFVVINENAAGIDLGSTFHYVALPEDRIKEGQSRIQVFATHTEGLSALADHLQANNITSVAMESTGVYWMGLYEILESRGFEVCLVNARHLKNVVGRKTDKIDSMWIQKLHSCGLLQASFIPSAEVRKLRSYVRQRQGLEEQKRSCILRMHKALDLMNIKVQYLLSDICGKCGMKIIRAIAQGERSWQVLSSFYEKRLKASKEEFSKSLQGNFKAEHVFVLQQALQAYDFYFNQMRVCERRIEQVMCLFADGEMVDLPLSPLRTKSRKGRKNDYEFDVKSYLLDIFQVDLCQIDGLDENSIIQLLAEIGSDLSKWKNQYHFVSWLQLAPKVKESAGKKKGHYKTISSNRASQVFKMAAMTVARSKTALGAFYRKLKLRKNAAVANKATARKIAIIFYLMVSRKEAYKPKSHLEFERQFRERKIKQLKRDARKYGFKLQESA